ncbi:TIGR02285 family protein [Candidatus Magnetomoraceae bacterium gMMP-13]
MIIKIKRLYFIIFLCYLNLMYCHVQIFAEDSVTWMEALVPPIYIHEGQNKGQGYEDVITKILQKNLTDYTHDKMLANIARMYHEFKEEKKVCNTAFFKTPEREKFMYFSIPSTFTLPPAIIIKKTNVNLFGNLKTVGLEDILKTKLKLGISRDRSYGKYIDAVLEKYKKQRNVFVHSGKDVFASLLNMLLKNRLDYILGLPEEVMYRAEKFGIQDKILTIALKENENVYDSWLGHVACSKNEWGKKFIEKINNILIKQRPTQAYRGAYERWLDENSIENYRRLYDEIFLNINK